MNGLKILSHSESETMQIGSRLSSCLKSGDIVCLFGQLGSGKTTFTKGMAKGLKVNPDKVNSPTFVLMNIYEGKLPMYHFDFYRMEDLDEVSAIGYDEFLYGNGIAVVEWADKLGPLMPKDRIEVHLSHKSVQKRDLKVLAKGDRYSQLLLKLESK